MVWGISCMAITVSIAIFKNEKDYLIEDNEIKLTIYQNYTVLWDIIKLPSMKILVIALLTSMVSKNIVEVKFKFFLHNI